MSLDPTRDEITKVSDLYDNFSTTNHVEILKRCVSIFGMLANYCKDIHNKQIPQTFHYDLLEAKKLAEEVEPKSSLVDNRILLLAHRMIEIRKTIIDDGITVDFEEENNEEIG